MNYNVNPAQLIQMIKSGQNPEQLMLSILEQRMGGTPMGANLINLAKGGKTAELETIARNMCQQKGLNYDNEMASFKQTLGIK